MTRAHGFDRRQALLAFLASGGAGALAGRQTPASVPESPEAVAAAAKLLGLEFNAEERELLARDLERQLGELKRLRELCARPEEAPASPLRPEGNARVASGSSTGRQLGEAASSEAPRADAGERALTSLDIPGLAELLKTRKLRSQDLVAAALKLLRKHDPKLFCVITLLPERALAAARKADAELDAGTHRGPLHGIPYGLKDLFSLAGAPTTWGAMPFREQRIEEDAAVVERLDEAGAVCVAKLSLGALAMGDRWFGGRTRNPWNPQQGSSGSSAGSAAAVAAGILPFAIGTETLGSIVSPSARCGITGLRPSFGRISRHGAMPLSWSMDKVGIIARDAVSTGWVLKALVGRDPRDQHSVDLPFSMSAPPVKELRVAVLGSSAFRGRRRARDRAALEVFRKQGVKLHEVKLPAFDARPLLVILRAEAAAVFDEITRDGRVRTLVSQGPGSWPRMFRQGRFLPAVAYLQAQRLRGRLIALWEAFEREWDVLISPTHAGGTLLPTNLCGQPTVVVPNGFDGRGRPGAFAITGRNFGEAKALAVAQFYQRATGHHRRLPAL